MDFKERALKDVEKLKEILLLFENLGLNKKYADAYTWAKNYLHDAMHFYQKGDYFSSFGAANYAYGIIDGILITEKKK
ncbi:MAG: DUF357 domain-containing protein [Candidatus Bilamarchaeaceae archaeon]